VEVVASLSQGRTAAAQCGLFTYKSVPVIFEPPCMLLSVRIFGDVTLYRCVIVFRCIYSTTFLDPETFVFVQGVAYV